MTFSSIVRGLGKGSTKQRAAPSCRSLLSDKSERSESTNKPINTLSETESTIATTRRRRSSAISVESDNLDQLLLCVEPNHEAVAEFNARRGSMWVDFSSSLGNFETLNQRKASALWMQSRLGLSWLDFDEDEIDAVPSNEIAQKRRVRFGGPAYNTAYDTIALSDMTEEEMVNCWFDEFDHEDLQIDVIETVASYRNRISDKVGDYFKDYDDKCARGLEHIISEELYEQREYRKQAVVEAVLAAQEAQRRTQGDACGLESIAAASKAISKLSIEKATGRGKSDAAEAAILQPRSRQSKLQFRLDVKRAQHKTAVSA